MRKYLILFCFLISVVSFSQEKKIDSLERIIRSSKNDSVKMMLYNKLRRITVYTNSKKSIEYNDSYIGIAKKLKDSFRIALGHLYYGNINVTTSNYNKALKHFFIANNYFEKTKDSFRISSTLNGIGATYMYSGNDTLSLKYFKESQKISSLLKDYRRSAIALNNIAEIYSNRNDLVLAENYLTQAYSEINKTNRKQYKILISITLANFYTKINQFKKATLLYNEMFKEIDTVTDTYHYALILKSYGNLYLKQNRNKLGLKVLLNSYAKFNRGNYSEESYHVMPDVIKAFERNGKYKKGLKLFNKYNKIRDSVFNIEKDKNLKNSLIKYETVKKDAQLKVLKLQKEKSEQQRKIFLFLALSGLLFLFLITYFLIKNKHKNIQIKKALFEKEMLLKEIHHRVKNNLQVVSSLLNIQKRQVKDKKTKQLFQESRNRVKAMSLIHQNLLQTNNLSGVDIDTYFKNLVSNLVKNYKTNKNKIDVNYHIKRTSLDIDTIISLGLIVNELISNILKYAFVNQELGIINIELISKDNKIHLVVEDNGKGLPKDFSIETTSSLGYKLVKAFVQKINANLVIDTSENGTKISIILS